MAEMYLNLAEILIELDALENTTGRLEEAKGLIDKIVFVQVVPTIDEAWKKAKSSGESEYC